ncbi:MAG TPA: hypothetical protein VHG72_18790 [Polyangia bacterium]|nr:hypothetical protein [Polyangia bacterium]
MSARRKTYWHLGADRRLPSDYEIATTRLLYHVERGGLSVRPPGAEFQARHQGLSPLASDRWDGFADPRATTYATYVALERDRESYTGRLLDSIETSDHDGKLAAAWVEELGDILSPLRYLCHGLQMLAAQVGHLAPGSRIAVALLFQCGDEIRRVQRLAYRLALLARRRPEIGPAGRALWQSGPLWQPARRAIERLLVTYDWGEALIALNVVVKPVVDDLFLQRLAERAEAAGDHVDAQILRALFEDCAWHRAWTEALTAFALRDRPENADPIARWTEAWTPAAAEIARAGAELLGLEPPAAEAAPARVRPEVAAAARQARANG